MRIDVRDIYITQRDECEPEWEILVDEKMYKSHRVPALS
jgi:hypothetical protein